MYVFLCCVLEMVAVVVYGNVLSVGGYFATGKNKVETLLSVL